MSALRLHMSMQVGLQCCSRPVLTVLCSLQKETIAVTAALAWGSLGCIYGDIGTSPLYVYSTIFSSSEPSQVSQSSRVARPMLISAL